ncbi:MAG: aminotransferase class V-fold PLP-dependent enzyme [Candidatus Lokiarchaeota archaeon]|nr:aminotransferase class V-fold PLP-dependent enzyme [Candidatus Lokiarchaeota archaeon]
MSSPSFLSFERVRNAIIGRNFTFRTPYGVRLLTYADYTASGRSLEFIEQFLIKVQREYANTHTEDDITGRHMTSLLHHAEALIKKALNAEDNCSVISVGTGATGAISKLQEILGVKIHPATKKLALTLVPEIDNLITYFNERKPVVFIGPYEHHSNDLMWREALVELITIQITPEGYFDLEDLKIKVSNPKFKDRLKIGTFSAASNVTGIKSPIYEIARIMHEYNGIACFDYAASAPYIKIDMNKDAESYIDAIYLSPHKFVGGPGSSGILVFNNSLYDSNIPPTCPSGGTVKFVSPKVMDFIDDTESREKAGTPGILQTIKAFLAIDLKDAIGISKIEEKELEYISRALKRLQKNKNIEILGPIDPHKRISIVSFKIKHDDKYIHPKLTTNLLNDLFGIQSRAGCMCAGSYGHMLLNIEEEVTIKIRKLISQNIKGINPGWCRVNFHYLHSELEFQFICDAIEFIADHGKIFLSEYRFNYQTGEWNHCKFNNKQEETIPTIKNIQEMELRNCFEESLIDRELKFASYMKEAKNIISSLEEPSNYGKFKNPVAEALRWFNFVHIENEI